MKICFWGNIARALDGKTDGGGELQIAFIARALASSGHQIVVADYNQKTGYVTPEGIRVIPIRRWHKGVRIFRTLTHRIPGLYETLKEERADIYYCRIRDFRHLIPWLVSRRLKSKFILHMASDLDAMDFRNRWESYYMAKSANLWWLFSGMLIEMVYPFLLKRADLVIVQHKGQEEILRRKNIRSRVLLNIIDTTTLPEPEKGDGDFIYVGWLDKRKGFPEFFQIVESAPELNYRVVGPPRDEIGRFYYNKLKEFPNVRLKGALSHIQTLKEISGSKALISTSPMEGFPNVFLEAWAYGKPVISLFVDPGLVIEKEGLGVNAHGCMQKMLKALRNPPGGTDFSRKAIKYVEENHAIIDSKVKEINKIFTDLVI